MDRAATRAVPAFANVTVASWRGTRLARAMVGWIPGGMAIMVCLVCAGFTTFTGGSGVTILALGGLMYPMLRDDGYPEGFSLGLVTASGSLGLLFPPSLPIIVYGIIYGLSSAHLASEDPQHAFSIELEVPRGAKPLRQRWVQIREPLQQPCDRHPRSRCVV